MRVGRANQDGGEAPAGEGRGLVPGEAGMSGTARGDDAAVSLPWRGVGHRCFGCSQDNPIGLGLAFRPSGEGLRASFELTELYASYPGVAHGGLLATLLDETMGNVVALRRDRLAFTVTLRVKYLAPVRIGRRYEVHGRLTGEDGRLYRVEGEILDHHGESLAMATGSYRAMTAEQAAREMTVGGSTVAGFEGHFHEEEGGTGA
jgi:acyl-coenzyme A thioesterase PaaI-like protein